MAIKLVGLTGAIEKVLHEYGRKALFALQDAAKTASDKAVQELTATSPTRRGLYAKDWTSEGSESPTGVRGYVIYNTRGGLTHLTEFGHVKRGGTGRTKAIAHIAPAEQNAIKNYEEEVIKLLEST